MTDFETRMRERKIRCENRMERGGGKSHIWTGAFIIIIGIAAFIKVSNPDLPSWFFSWKTFLIALGLFIGLKHNFKGAAWFIMILVGGAFLFADLYPDMQVRDYVWPAVLVAIGAIIIFRPRRKYRWEPVDAEKKNTVAGATQETTVIDASYDTKEDYVDSTSIFGGAKKNIISKNFKGGDLVNIFGGTELDLTRADFTGTAVVDLTTIFGGTKFIVPSNWTIKSEAVVIFGGVEDKRNTQSLTDTAEKVLILKGIVMFGGIEIKSF